MCGITGFLDPRGLDAESGEILARMVGTLRHRGPDDDGGWLDAGAGIALGHRRLSIIDLSPLGHQPMHSADGRWVIVYNGEIYNFATLRRELESAGHAFRSHSDTEVILAGLMHWGFERTLSSLAGMFAIALWDRERRVLHLVRDRLGEKPLYFGKQAGVLLFGSELKALLRHPAAAGFTVNRHALGAFLRHGYVPGPLSIYESIQKLPAGCRAEIASNGDIRIVPYWTLADAVVEGRRTPVRGSDERLVDEFESMLGSVLKEQVVADVPVGAFLSGGIDSSTIVALMEAQENAKVRTFSIGFHEGAYDEAPDAAEVARHLGTDHTEFYVTSEEARAIIPEFPRIYDEPFADSSQIPTVLLCRLARQHVTVALSGDGGDELLGGYTRYFQAQRHRQRFGLLPRPLREVAAGAITRLSPAAWDRIFALTGPFTPGGRVVQGGDRVVKLAAVLRARDLSGMYGRLVSYWDAEADGIQTIGHPPAHTSHMPPAELSGVEQMMYWDALTYLPDDIMVKVDRASMAASLETRAPFLDHRLVEFAWRLPLDFKVRGGVGKWGMRRLAERYVPRALLDRPKQGFGVPIDSWLRGPLRQWATDMLAPDRLKREGFFSPEPVQRRLREHLAGTRNWQYHLWAVLMFESWLEQARAAAREPAGVAG